MSREFVLVALALLLAGCATQAPVWAPAERVTPDAIKMERRNKESCEERGGTYLGFGRCDYSVPMPAGGSVPR